MSKQALHIIKIGGNVVDDEATLHEFLLKLAARKEAFILVHGGGKIATNISQSLGISTQMVDGRRITDGQTLDVVVMVYAGLINKKIVARLQANGKNAIGLSGADANMIPARKREHAAIDYGFVGDFNAAEINVGALQSFIDKGLLPVIAPITHDGKGQLLNTNADTIASGIAVALSAVYETSLYYCFEKKGVLSNPENEYSVIEQLNRTEYETLKSKQVIHAGMIPKLDNAFNALDNGVQQVIILHAKQINDAHAGTRLVE